MVDLLFLYYVEDGLGRIQSKGEKPGTWNFLVHFHRGKYKSQYIRKWLSLTQDSSEKKFQGCSCTADLESNESMLEQETKKLQRMSSQRRIACIPGNR